VNEKLIAAARSTFGAGSDTVLLGAVLEGAESHAEPLIHVSAGMLNRHGLIAGATGTGKTKTLQLIAEQLAERGVPVFLADVKGDLTGLAAPGESNERVQQRVQQTGAAWKATAFPVEFLSLSGLLGTPVRATISSFGPLLLAKVLGLNDTQTSVLTLVFEYCDDRGLLLLDLSDLRAVLQYLTNEGVAELKEYGSISKQSVSVILRKLVELEAQGAEAFFGEPEFDVDDLFEVDSAGRGRISILELRDVQDRPALFSTFLLWLLARLYNELPEVGDLPKPKLVFFFDEAHLLFEDASKALKAQIEQVVRLIRSKGVGVIFITQSPKDIPADVLGQLGNRVQHALRAFTPDDEKNLRAAARTFPKSEFYDIQQTLTSLGTGEALVTVLTERGTPTPTFAARLLPPRSRMGPLTDSEFQTALSTSKLIAKYRAAVDRESARERLAERTAEAARTEPVQSKPAGRQRQPKEPPSALETIVMSPMARTVAGAVTRGLMGALLGRRRR
jgi:DNA helicase HerA-like ATPase